MWNLEKPLNFGYLQILGLKKLKPKKPTFASRDMRIYAGSHPSDANPHHDLDFLTSGSIHAKGLKALCWFILKLFSSYSVDRQTTNVLYTRSWIITNVTDDVITRTRRALIQCSTLAHWAYIITSSREIRSVETKRCVTRQIFHVQQNSRYIQNSVNAALDRILDYIRTEASTLGRIACMHWYFW